MKNYILISVLILFIAAFVSCKKDDDSKGEGTVFANWQTVYEYEDNQGTNSNFGLKGADFQKDGRCTIYERRGTHTNCNYTISGNKITVTGIGSSMYFSKTMIFTISKMDAEYLHLNWNSLEDCYMRTQLRKK